MSFHILPLPDSIYREGPPNQSFQQWFCVSTLSLLRTCPNIVCMCMRTTPWKSCDTTHLQSNPRGEYFPFGCAWAEPQGRRLRITGRRLVVKLQFSIRSLSISHAWPNLTTCSCPINAAYFWRKERSMHFQLKAPVFMVVVGLLLSQFEARGDGVGELREWHLKVKSFNLKFFMFDLRIGLQWTPMSYITIKFLLGSPCRP